MVRKAGEGGDRASPVRILILRVFILPVVPDFVNHLHGDNVVSMTKRTAEVTRTAWCMKNNGSFEDHVGPSIHSGGPVPLGQKPLKSLRKPISHNSRIGSRTQNRSPSPRDYEVNAAMNPLHKPIDQDHRENWGDNAKLTELDSIYA